MRSTKKTPLTNMAGVLQTNADAERGETTHSGLRPAAAVEHRAGRVSSSRMSKVAWIPKGELEHGEWMAAGQRLGAIGRCSQWWVGDWIRYGTAKWGEKYSEAARVTGYDVASLRNMAWVASRFDPSLRSDKLTWSHHVLLAPLDADKQRYWIQRASEMSFSVADLRIELRTAAQLEGHEQKEEQSASQEGDADVVACPHCGHEFVLSAGVEPKEASR